MTVFVLALTSASPFVQWTDVDASTLLYLLPWVLLTFLLVPKGGETKALRISWRTVLVVSLCVVALIFVALVVYYLIAGG